MKTIVKETQKHSERMVNLFFLLLIVSVIIVSSVVYYLNELQFQV